MTLIVCYSCGRQRTVKKLKKAAVLVCSNCGASNPFRVSRITSRMRLNGVVETDIDGVELHEARRHTLAGLYWIAEQRKYKRGWASVKFKSMFGSWPNGESDTPAEPPKPPLLKWVKRSNAPYAKMMREKEKAEKLKKAEPISTLMSEDDFNVSWR